VSECLIIVNESFSPPNPPILGGTGVQSPSPLEDLGGEKDLYVHGSQLEVGTEIQSPPELGDLGGVEDLGDA
jgi:hypothetical protein